MANNPNDMPDASAWGQFRSQLAQAGWKQADINDAYGEQVNGRTWRELSDEGVLFLRDAPKATGGQVTVEQAQGGVIDPASIRLNGQWTPSRFIRVRVVIDDGQGGMSYPVFEYTPSGDLNANQAANELGNLIDTSLLLNAVTPGPQIRISPENPNHVLTVVVIVHSN